MNTPAPAAVTIRPLSLSHPWRWLALGWRDLQQCGMVSLAHGLVLCLGGMLMLALAHNKFWLLAGAFSGFLMVAPVLAVGLYALSRALENQAPANAQLVLRTWLSWRQHSDMPGHKDWRLVRFGLLLGLAGTGWVLTSASLITLLSPTPIQKPVDFLRYVVLEHGHSLFELWMLLGGLMAAPIFASSAIALPLLLERRINVLDAVLASWRAVLSNPLPMALWAGIIMLLTLLGLCTGLLGLILIIPVLGHASWHAYRDVADASALAERLTPSPEKRH